MAEHESESIDGIVDKEDEEERRYERRLLMASLVSMGGGMNNSAASRAVANRLGGNAHAIRIDWNRRHQWGHKFLNLKNPAAMLIDGLLEYRAIQGLLSVELDRLKPNNQGEVERDIDGSVVRDKNGDPILKPLKDENAYMRRLILRDKLNILSREIEMKKQLKLLPEMPGQGEAYQFGKKSNIIGGEMNVEQLSEHVNELRTRLIELKNGNDPLEEGVKDGEGTVEGTKESAD